MPLGSVPWNRRLGIANSQTKRANEFGLNVLLLPSNFPIYQQQLVHNTQWRDGPFVGEEWCGTENNVQQQCTLREISAHDTLFSRRNLSNTDGVNSFIYHRDHYLNQLYYVNNEPEFGSRLSTNPACSAYCWEPRDRVIDQYLSNIFVNPSTQFWATVDETEGVTANCSDLGTPFKRIRAEALAYVYLRLKEETELLGRGHFVLPPSSSDARLGWDDPNVSTDIFWTYWRNFFNFIHNGISLGDPPPDPISPSELKALHIHHYSNSPLDDRFTTMTPLESVAMSATFLRKGVDWYRTTHNGGNPLELDILLSEMGPHWFYASNQKHIAGGWKGFQTGLEWWNTWLCWLTRFAPSDCNLQGWDTGAHTLHACIHHPSMVPFADIPDDALVTTRNQWYFNSDDWCTDVFYDMTVVEIPSLTREIKFRAYEKSFSIHETISWEGRTWNRTPFGACYAVWANVGADPVTTNLNTGWVLTTDQGTVLDADVSLPAGWSTIYFPVIKKMGDFNPSTQFGIQWVHPDGRIYSHGVISMAEFSDSDPFYYNEINQDVYAAMIIPAVCYASTARTVKVRLTRNLTGVGAYLGRPIALPKICSWFITQ